MIMKVDPPMQTTHSATCANFGHGADTFPVLHLVRRFQIF